LYLSSELLIINIVRTCFQQVGADNKAVLDHIIDSLTSFANPTENNRFSNQNSSKISLKLGKAQENGVEKKSDPKKKAAVLILGAGQVCQPAAQMLSSFGRLSTNQWYKTLLEDDFDDQIDVDVIVGSLYLKDAEQVFLAKIFTFTLVLLWKQN